MVLCGVKWIPDIFIVIGLGIIRLIGTLFSKRLRLRLVLLQNVLQKVCAQRLCRKSLGIIQ